MKKILCLIMSLFMVCGMMTGCGDSRSAGGNADSSGTGDKAALSIVTTIFPEYDWVKEIMGDRAANADITMLLDSGVDLHSYQPTAEDIIKISNCDLFIYVGGESDSWVEDVLKEKKNENMVTLNLMELLAGSVKEEEIVEGMQAEEEMEGQDAEEGPEYDEHVWLSVRNAQVLCSKIAEALTALDAEGAETYGSNLEAYNAKLADLDGQYQQAVDNGATKTVVFGDRFPFRYLVDDYGIDYYAAFVGCSAESEASFETISFLAGKVDELGLKAVIALEGSDHRIAETIISNTSTGDQQILEMDSMQSTTAKDVEAGAKYLDIMTENLNTLAQALQK